MVGALMASTLALAQEVSPPVVVHASPALWPEDGGAGGDVELLLTIDATGAVTDVTGAVEPGRAPSPRPRSPPRRARLRARHAGRRARQRGARLSLPLRSAASPPSMRARCPPRKLTGQVLTRGTRETSSRSRSWPRTTAASPRWRPTPTAASPSRCPPGRTQRAGHRVGPREARLQGEPQARPDRSRCSTGSAAPTSRPYETVVRGQVDRAELSRVTLSRRRAARGRRHQRASRCA